MLCEMHCRINGCVGSRGGSMHLIDKSVGMAGTSAIVGGAVPIATGAALAAKMKREDRVVVVFLGDATTEEGVTAESLNFAALKKLPVVRRETNFYSVQSPLGARQRRATSRVGEGMDANPYPSTASTACKCTMRCAPGRTARAGEGTNVYRSGVTGSVRMAAPARQQDRLPKPKARHCVGSGRSAAVFGDISRARESRAVRRSPKWKPRCGRDRSAFELALASPNPMKRICTGTVRRNPLDLGEGSLIRLSTIEPTE